MAGTPASIPEYASLPGQTRGFDVRDFSFCERTSAVLLRRVFVLPTTSTMIGTRDVAYGRPRGNPDEPLGGRLCCVVVHLY